MFLFTLAYSQTLCELNPQVKTDQGDFYSKNPCYGMVLTSPNGSCYRIRVQDDGTLITDPVACSGLNIGDMHAGGIIFYLDPSGQGGLVASKNDVAQADWGCYGTVITGADGTIIGSGNQNTQDILYECLTPNIAADLCADFLDSGFSDWFLPSIDELSEMYFNIGQGANGSNNNIGNFTSSNLGKYASSTESSSTRVRIVLFATGTGSGGAGGISTHSKAGTLNVRPIRAF